MTHRLATFSFPYCCALMRQERNLHYEELPCIRNIYPFLLVFLLLLSMACG